MSIERNITIKLKGFLSDRRRSEKSATVDSICCHISEIKEKTVNFVMLWGASDKSHISEADRQCIQYLVHFLKTVQDSFEIKTNLRLIFTDTHAYLNGYEDSNFYTYISEVSELLQTLNFKFELSSSLCDGIIKEQGYAIYKDFIDSIVASSISKFDSIKPFITDTAALSNFYKYALKHCNRIGKHPSGIFFKDQEAAAKGYLYFAFLEKDIITKNYKDSFFITYMSREEEFALPKLPLVRLFSIKSGSRTRPWFIEN